MPVITKRVSLRGASRALRALAFALPLAVAAPLALSSTQAAADSFGFYYGSGFHRGHDWDDGWRYRRFYHPRRVVVVAPPVYYYPPPRTVVVQQPAVAPTCTSGDWRQFDGSIVQGVACLQPNGTWQLQ